MSSLQFSSPIKHINMLLFYNKIAGLPVPVVSGLGAWPARVFVGCCSLDFQWVVLHGWGQTRWVDADTGHLSSTSRLWAVMLICSHTWLLSSLPFGDQPPGVCSNEQAAFPSYILVSPPFENKTLPHLLASGIAIIAWRITGGNSIWGKPCWFKVQTQ